MLIGYFQTDLRIHWAQELHIGQSLVWCLFLVTSGRFGVIYFEVRSIHMEIFLFIFSILVGFLSRKNPNPFIFKSYFSRKETKEKGKT